VAFQDSDDVLALKNRLTRFGAGIAYVSSTGRYGNNLTSGVTTPFTGGTDAGRNE
jgi:hypothetical protein